MTYMKEQEMYKTLEKTKGTAHHANNPQEQMAFELQKRMGALLNLEKKDIDKFSHSTPAKWLNEKIWDNFTPIPQPKNAKAKKVRAVEMSAVQQPAHPARPKSAALGRRSQAQPMDD